MNTQNTTSLQVEGMSCSACAGRVEKALSAIPGVDSATVDLAAATARVSSDGTVDVQVLTNTLNEAGYPATIK